MPAATTARAILAALAFAALAPGAEPPAKDPAPRPERIATMDARDLRPGMTGYGLTVFSGETIEKFDVRILGVLRNNVTGTDMIVADLDHPLIREHGVVAGMSGSPVFIDGKLIGAVAFGWGMSVKPVGGIQPIKGMLEVLDQVTEAPVEPTEMKATISEWPAARQALAESGIDPARLRPLEVPGATLAGMGIADVDARSTVTFEPLLTPVMIGSNSAATLEMFQHHFAASGMTGVLAGAAGAPAGAVDSDFRRNEIRNGDAIGIAYAEGDLNLAAVGTVTYVEGDRLVAFGHPMDGAGAADLPASRSEIVAVVPSLSRPFKLSNVSAPIGALRQDRSTAIGVTRRARPELKPLTITLEAPERGMSRTLNYRLLNKRDVLPFIVDICFTDAVGSLVREAGPITASAEMVVEMMDGTRITRRQFMSGEFLVPAILSSGMSRDLSRVLNNPAVPLEVRSIAIKATIGDKLQVSALRDARLERASYAPGETIRGWAEFERWREPSGRVSFSLAIPADLPDGRYDIALIDGMTRDTLRQATTPELRRLRDAADVYRRVDASYPMNALYVVLLDGGRQVAIDDRAMAGMPRSIATTTAATMKQSNILSFPEGRVLAESSVPTTSFTAGQRRFTIDIRRDLPSAQGDQ